MKYEKPAERGRLKGYMWECVILKLLKTNDFFEISSIDGVRTKMDRQHFFEMCGRGAWHQIDCPCDYQRFIPFINPIRLLAEVKFLSGRVKKDAIREYIGVIKDIGENYFTAHNLSTPTTRYTELGVFFSASGFDPEAEQLAFAHNIKTVSHENLPLLDDIIHHYCPV